MSNRRTHWCNGCNVPLTDEKCENCGEHSSNSLPDLRPIFPEEIDFLNSELNYNLDPSKVYFKHNNNVFQNGKKLFSFHVSENGLTAKKCSSQPENLDGQSWKKMLSANQKHLNLIENEAIDFIKKTVASYAGKKTVVSFSGGKDSAVTAYLVKRALGEASLVFSNTTIEFPETVEFARNFSNEMEMAIVELRPTNEFMSICNDLGPPSRMMRWCCFTQKSAPINAFYAESDKQFLTFGAFVKRVGI
jgi:phosphoadenosine phosphosulfate reductase